MIKKEEQQTVFQLVLTPKVLQGLDYCKKVVATLETLKNQCPDDIMPYASSIMIRLAAESESLIRSWENWVAENLNEQLRKSDYLGSLTLAQSRLFNLYPEEY